MSVSNQKWIKYGRYFLLFSCLVLVLITTRYYLTPYIPGTDLHRVVEELHNLNAEEDPSLVDELGGRPWLRQIGNRN